MNGVILTTNTHPESCFIDYMKALISGDRYQLMPKKIRVRELQTERGKPTFQVIRFHIAGDDSLNKNN